MKSIKTKKAIGTKPKPKALVPVEAPNPVGGPWFLTVTEKIKSAAQQLKFQYNQIYRTATSSATGRIGQLISLKPCDSAEGRKIAAVLASFGHKMVELFPPLFDSYLARHRVMNLLRELDDPDGALRATASLRGTGLVTTDEGSVRRAFGRDPLTYSLPNNETGAMLFLEHYLPTEFRELIEDLSQTRLPVYRLDSRLVELGLAFVSAFEGLQVVRIELPGDLEESSKTVQIAHSDLIRLLSVIKHEATRDLPTTVAIRGDMGHISVAINGVDVGLAESEKRTLVSLALLRERDDFHVEDFAQLYFGNSEGDSQKRFDTCVKKGNLKRIPGLQAEAVGKGRRQIRGVSFNLLVPEAVLREFLSMKHPRAK